MYLGHLKEHDDTSQIQLNNYNCITQRKTCSNKAGLIIKKKFIKYKYKKVNFLKKHKHWEAQLKNDTGSDISKAIIIGNMYWSPKDLNANHRQSIYELTIIEKDLFCDCLATLAAYSFFQKKSLPTRFTHLNGTLIDNFFGKLTEH